MKKYFLTGCIFALSMIPISAAQQNGKSRGVMTKAEEVKPIKWYVDYDEAQAVAKQANKPLFLFFTGSDWCGWCKKMDQEVFTSSYFSQAVGEDFIFVEVDFPMQKTLTANQQKQNNDLKQKYGVTGYPTMIILDPNGNFIAETSYQPGGPKAYADYLKQLLN
ncbi:MAG: thioredoxin family protein [Chlamydiales bacterium]